MGYGVIPLKEILNSIKDQGWNKCYDIEIFSYELWKMEPKEFLKMAREKYDKLSI